MVAPGKRPFLYTCPKAKAAGNRETVLLRVNQKTNRMTSNTTPRLGSSLFFCFFPHLHGMRPSVCWCQSTLFCLAHMCTVRSNGGSRRQASRARHPPSTESSRIRAVKNDRLMDRGPLPNFEGVDWASAVNDRRPAGGKGASGGASMAQSSIHPPPDPLPNRGDTFPALPIDAFDPLPQSFGGFLGAFRDFEVGRVVRLVLLQSNIEACPT